MSHDENPFVSAAAVAQAIVDLDRAAGCCCVPPVLGVRLVQTDRPDDAETVKVRPLEPWLARVAGLDDAEPWEVLSAHLVGCPVLGAAVSP